MEPEGITGGGQDNGRSGRRRSKGWNSMSNLTIAEAVGIPADDELLDLSSREVSLLLEAQQALQFNAIKRVAERNIEMHKLQMIIDIREQ